MKKLIILPLLLLIINGFSQSDNCVTGTILNLDATGNGCATGTTTGSTSENIMFGACNAAPANEVWYTYVVSGSQNDFTLTPSGLTNSEIVLYTGGCPSTTGSLVTCGVVTGSNTLNLSWGFTVGTQVWVGVMSNAGNDGGFDLCVNSYNPPAGGGNACAGAIPLCDKNATTNIPDMSIFTSSGAAPSCFPGGGNQDVWFQFTVTQTGTLEWEAAATIGGSGVEWDWTIYDITNGCVGTGNEVEVACNYNYGNEASLAGMLTGAAGNCPESAISNDPALEYCDPIVVTAGQTYAIQIDNYTNTVVTGLDFSFGPGMTAEISPDVDFTISPTTVTCGASVLVTITDNSTGIPDWDFGDGSTFTGNNPPAHNYTTPGTYAITATIAGACSDFQTEFVQLFGPVTTVPDTVTETCAGDCDGSISLTTSGGSGQYSYLWAPGGETTPSISGQCANNYSVTVTDAVCGNTVENIVLSTGPSCSVPCNMDSIIISRGFCINNLFSVTSNTYFTDPPTTGTLTITIDDGTTTYDTIINAPFSSPASWTTDIPTGGGAYTVTSTFSDDLACTISIGDTAPPNCDCSANVGTFTNDVDGTPATNNVKLCFGESFTMTTNGDMIPPAEATSPPITTYDPAAGYNPGIGYLVYSCLPAVFPQNDLWDAMGNPIDPCLLGLVGYGNSFSDLNTGAIGAPFTNSTLYFVPITFYDTIQGYYSFTNTVSNCYSMGVPVSVQYLPELVSSNPTPNCQDSSFTITINGGAPQIDGSLYTASNLLPATASFVNTTTTNGGTIQINGLQNGDMYSFDVADTNGCPLTISGGPFIGLPQANAGVDDTTCTLTYNLNAVPSFGTGTWTGPVGITFAPANSPTATVTATTSGTYNLFWTEDNTLGCTDVDTVTITFSDPSFTTTIVDATCGQTNGSITVNASNGVSPYTYSNDNGITFQVLDSFVNLVSGPYDVVIQDAVGCQFSNVENVNNSNSPIIDSLVLTAPLCNGDCNGEILVYASQGINPLQYSINGGALQLGNNFTGLCAATPYTILVEDNLGCQVTKDTILTDPPLMVLDSIVTTNETCNESDNASISIYANGGTGQLNYSIDNGVSFVTTSLFSNLTAGTYDIEIRDANGCSLTDQRVLTEPLALSIPNVLTHVSCSGGTNGQVVVAPQGGTSPYTYSWTTSTNTTPVENNLPTGSTTVTVTDAKGCTLDSTFTLTEPAAFTYTTATQNANCNQPDGWTAVLNFAGGTGAYTYDWGAGPTSNDTLFNQVPGSYSVTVRDGNTCDTTFTLTIGNNPGITADVTSSTNATCKGGADGTATVTGSDPLTTYDYSWSTVPAQLTQTATGLSAGTYYVTITDQATGCSASDSVIITEPTRVTISSVSPNVTICAGQTTNITSTATGGSGAGYVYTWNNGLGVGQNHTVSLLPNTTTNYEVTAVDANGCPSDTGRVTVIVHPSLSVIASTTKDTVCPGVSTTLNALASFGNGGPYTYSWSPTTNMTGSNTSNPTVTPTGATTYTVTLNDGCSPSVTDTIRIYLYNLPNPQASADTLSLCIEPREAITFYNLTDTTNGMLDTNRVTWNFGDGTTATQPWDTIQHTYNQVGTYTVSMTVYSQAPRGGCSKTNVVVNQIDINALPVADFSSTPNPTSMFETEVQFADQSGSAIDNYHWDFGGLDTSNYPNPIYIFPDDTNGVYPVTLTVIDMNGCTDDITKLVTITAEYGIYIPNAFTPDFDFKNDMFGPTGFGISPEDYHFMIFDRWGEKLFETNKLFEPWDGTYKGNKVPGDVYVWKLFFKDYNDKKHEKIGHVTIIQ
ncbi:MAG: gliding motility-associated C-terminal domain-containing protein [Flavobacteriales bacterium]|nr:gliding motility-associated C-terminal domain-containing protein [Flavobacteriales bacterium]